MGAQEEAIKLLYQIFSQRFKASELQKSVDRPVKLGLLGCPADTRTVKEIMLTEARRVETNEQALVELDVDGNWPAQLGNVNALLVLINENLVKATLFDTLKQKLVKELPYVLLCHGQFNHVARLEARELQTEIGLKPFYQVNELTERELRPHLGAFIREFEAIALPLGRRLVFFRTAAARHFIRKVSRQNLTLAVFSTIPASVPIIGVIASMLAAAGEMIVMTSNQLKLCLQIAGLYGMQMNFSDRIRELWPVIGSGIGWRQLSRTAVGLVPVAGPAIKPVVAYSGTYVVGESARWYYETGRKMSAAQYSEVVSQARREAMEQAKQQLQRLRGRKSASGAGVPPPDAASADGESE